MIARRKARRLELVVLLGVLAVCLVILGLGWRECAAHGGKYVRGLLWMECVR